MIRNYLKTALRQLWKHKLFSAFNVFGLATSMSVCLLLILVLIDQYSYDTFHENKDRIYRVITSKSEKNIPLDHPEYATTALSLAEPLTDQYSFVEKTVRLVPIGSTFEIQNKRYESNGKGYAVDPAFLDVFSFGWLSGDSKTALQSPRSVVLTQSTADLLFPDQDPLGQVVALTELGSYTVTGVLPDPPVRSHIRFDFLLSFSSITSFTEEERGQLSIYSFDDIWRGLVYILLAEDAGRDKLDRALAEMAASYSRRDPDSHYLFQPQALRQVLPSRDLSNDIGIGTPRIVLYFLIALGLIIILSAGFNYTSLSIARSLKRSKEIGIRKVIGAEKKDIVLQFVGEAVLLSLLSLLVALGLLEFLIYGFYGLDPFVQDIFTLTKTPGAFLLFLGFSLLVGLLAGLFPALNIATYRPIQAIQQLAEVKLLARIGIRKVLIITQFTLSLVFILAVTIVLRQQRHVLEAELGSRTENLLNIRLKGVDYEVFAQQVRQLKGVRDVSASSNVILTGENATAMATFNEQADSVLLFHNTVSSNYLSNLEIELIAGENFPSDLSARGSSFIILNEKAVRRMGFPAPAAAIGKSITLDSIPLTVTGVVKDFHHDDIWFAPIQPFGFRPGVLNDKNANITLTGKDVRETLASIRTIWNDLAPETPLTAFFTDERIYHLTKFFRMGSRIIGFVGFLTIVISCMGLLGMVLYTVEGRIKEVGIRKVLGASVGQLVWELSRGFFLLLIIAVIIALPITLLGANLWLQNFLIRITLGPAVILPAVAVISGLGFLMVVSQTYRAARENPAETLRTE